MADNDDGPQLVRPIPRRPFELNLTGPSPPSSTTPLPAGQQQEEPEDLPQPWRASLPPASAFARLLSPTFQASFDGTATPPPRTPPLSRSDSTANLGSTLAGIFRQVPHSSSSTRLADGNDSDTPWGTGARTPVRRPGLDDKTFELMRKRAGSASRPAMSTIQPDKGPRTQLAVIEEPSNGLLAGLLQPKSPVAVVFSLLLRAGLLAFMGMGYGVLVRHLHNEHNLAAFAGETVGGFAEHGPITPMYLGSWGVMGVVLGVLLPWFDSVWERWFGKDEAVEAARGGKAATDWALVVRGIGAFVGIVFAIRKLPWASTLQVSATLALTNPFLWYIVDRSKPGFVFSAVFGIASSLVLMRINPDIVPAPSGNLPSHHSQDNSSHGSTSNASAAWSPNNGGAGLASEETVVMAIWMMSVLFCSCVCFGNIGRRLALSSPTPTMQER